MRRKYLVKFREREEDPVGERRYYVASKQEADRLVFEILKHDFWAEILHVEDIKEPAVP